MPSPSVRLWIIKHDLPLGIYIKDMDSREQVAIICDKYDLSFEAIVAAEEEKEGNGEKLLLKMLNEIK